MHGLNGELNLNGIRIGGGQPPVLMPEIGTYFNGDFKAAEAAIRAVKCAGLSVLKGEVFHSTDIVLNDGFVLNYATASGVKQERYRDIISRKIAPFEAWRDLYAVCTDLDMGFVVTAYDFATVDFLVDIEASAIKLANNNVIHVPLLRHAGRSGLPVILDARKCSYSEICSALEVLTGVDCHSVVVMHSPDGSPSDAADNHLLAVDAYRQSFGCPVGLTCHYPGSHMVLAAAALGYDLIEKPFCADPTIDEVDTPWALALDQLQETREAVETFWAARGSASGRFDSRPTHDAARMGLVARHDLAAGDVVSLDTVTFAWPCRGVSVADWDIADGAELMQPVMAGAPIGWKILRVTG